MSRLPTLAASSLLAACAIASASAFPPAWPQVTLPRDIRVFDIGQQVTANDLPMRVSGFISPAGRGQVAQAFRAAWGHPLVENELGTQLVLGRRQGDYYITVQIESALEGSRGIVAITNLKAAHEGQDEARESAQLWQRRLLPGSRVISRMVSRDGDRMSVHLVFLNGHSAGLNRERVESVLAEEGLQPERAGRDGTALFFKGPASEAMATIHQDASGQTTTVLNILTAAKRGQ